MSVPNQKIVQIRDRQPRDSDHLYVKLNIDVTFHAMRQLNYSGFKMWFYINKNAENFRLELSLKACEEEGIKKDSYYNGIDELIRKRYLVPVREGSNIYNFYENQEPTIFEKKTVPVKTEITENGQSGKANGQTETQREQGSKGSKNQISCSVIPTDDWENPNFFRNSHREI